jgi:ribosome-binding factor A
MPSKLRLDRIGGRFREELSEILLLKMNDPRLSGISVTDVKVDRELAFADVYVSAVEGAVRTKEVLEGLEHASGFLRHELSDRIDLRVFPRLRFHWDPTPERADRIEKVLADLRQQSATTQLSPQEAVNEQLPSGDDEETSV